MVVSARRCGDRSRGIRSVLVGISRRVVIITSGLVGVGAGVGGWALLAENRLAPGRSLIDQAMGRCDIPTPLLDAKPGRLVEGSFFSAHRRKTVSYTLAYPPKAVPGARLPVCLVLHGYGVDHDAAFDDIGYHRLLAAVVGARTPPFVLASVDGGDGYWHPHAAGAASADDPLGMLTKDFPVVLSQHGLLVNRFAMLGWSMGGFGALLAATETPQRFVAVAASAPAFWRSFDEARSVNEGAFDSADEWREWGDLLSRAEKLKGPRIRIDCGESDSFASAVKALRDRLSDPAVVHLATGCHDDAFWRAAAPAQLRFIGDALKAR
jgi:S-formylglutathione hydrolase FrmB